MLGIDLHVVEDGGVSGDAFHQFRNAATRRGLVALAGAQGVYGGVDDLLRAVEIRPARTKIDGAIPERKVVDFGNVDGAAVPVHPQDDGKGQADLGSRHGDNEDCDYLAVKRIEPADAV